jgi:hypothetical protein
MCRCLLGYPLTWSLSLSLDPSLSLSVENHYRKRFGTSLSNGRPIIDGRAQIQQQQRSLFSVYDFMTPQCIWLRRRRRRRITTSYSLSCGFAPDNWCDGEKHFGWDISTKNWVSRSFFCGLTCIVCNTL